MTQGTFLEALVLNTCQNLADQRSDRFDEGVRQAAALVGLLQQASAAADHAMCQRLSDAALTCISSAMLAKQRADGDSAPRQRVLRLVSEILAQTLVHGKTLPAWLRCHAQAQREDLLAPEAAPSDVELQRLAVRQLVQLQGCGFAGWSKARDSACIAMQDQRPEEDTNSSGPLNSMIHMVAGQQTVDPVTGELNAILENCAPIFGGMDSLLAQGNLSTAHHEKSLQDYFTLRPQAMFDVLREILCAAAASAPFQLPKLNGTPTIRQLIASQPLWASSISAIAQSPALHVTARSTLQSWLAASGNMAVWRLHWELFSIAAASPSPQHALQLAPTVLQLYPGWLRCAARLLHGARETSNSENVPNLADLEAALGEVRRAAVVGRQSGTEGLRSNADAAEEEVWALLLDVPSALHVALSRVPWAAFGDHLESEHGGDVALSSEPAPAAAAEWLAAVMWPFSEAHQRMAAKVLQLQLEGRSDAAGAVVLTMRRWQAEWA